MSKSKLAAIAEAEQFERDYRAMFGEPISKPTDSHDLSQPDPRPDTPTVTTYGAYEAPITGSVGRA